MVKRINEPEYQQISSCEAFKTLSLANNTESYLYYSSLQEQADNPQKPVIPSAPGGSTKINPYYEQFPSFFDPAFEEEPEATPLTQFSQTAFFHTVNGKFAPSDSYWTAKGVPSDRDGRMLSHYLDVEAYQEQMRLAQLNPQKRPKVTKK